MVKKVSLADMIVLADVQLSTSGKESRYNVTVPFTPCEWTLRRAGPMSLFRVLDRKRTVSGNTKSRYSFSSEEL
jgi:catalase (peroxidase I)